ncbi:MULTISPECIES: peptidoglycan-binding domain-containing protein [unclassified Streptomyces]|uniref:peptidoglycan-binding domain-containing protein n=1 Tax=unclassified Streptomyces TaxID=2593676 RepID=UPI000AA19C73|nr:MULTISPECIES: peptidoglycan-binding protein [unclassified Streptomyces]
MKTRKRMALAVTTAALGAGLALAPAASAAPASAAHSTAAASASCGYYNGTALTKAGQTGSAARARIREVQCLINVNTAYPTILDEDGAFGTKTYNAVLTVQKKAYPHTSSEWDGQVGPHTWAKLRAGVWW